MRRTREVIRLFLASPDDVVEERTLAEKVVAEVNRNIAPKLDFLIELIRWEEMVPGTGRPEQIILDQANIEFSDVFVGILWNRFGTPTGRADSGTAEEFEIAYQAWQKLGKPRIMLYFCQRPANLQTEEELLQKTGVIRFRNKLSSLGLFKEFQQPSEFEELLRQHLTKHLLDEVSSTNDRYRSYERAAAKEPSNIPTELDLSQMVQVPAGKFLAGRVPSEAVIDYDFYIDIHPVTNRQFFTFLKETGYMQSQPYTGIASDIERFGLMASKFAEHPVTRVTWYDAVAYAAWCGKRLPTAMEWEKAARGSKGNIFPWGNKFDAARCNSAESGIGETTPVSQYKNGKSPYGCLDMAGNVFEWTNDWTNKPRFSTAPNSEKLNHGGSYNRSAADLICWYAESDPPTARMSDVGFRCAFAPEGVATVERGK